MINTSKLKSLEFNQALYEIEDRYVNELENMLISKLIEEKSVHLHGKYREILEFAGRTNYKIRLKIPNKNVWSISFRDFRESIRKVLRTGKIFEYNQENMNSAPDNELFDLPICLLLHVLPTKEYENRSFVGNKVIHPTLGNGKVISISDSGNVDVEFEDRVAKLRPNYIKLKLTGA